MHSEQRFVLLLPIIYREDKYDVNKTEKSGATAGYVSGEKVR